MRLITSLFFVSLAIAGMSGTYTIKPDGTGDFSSFYEAAESLTSQGVSGDCEFLAYTGTYSEHVELSELINNHTYTLTFRPAEGESVTITYGGFECGLTDKLKFVGLVFDEADFGIELYHCNGCRIEDCVFRGMGGGIRVLGCDDDTVIGNSLEVRDLSPALAFEEYWEHGGHLVANNLVRCYHGEATVTFQTVKSRLAFNTIVAHGDDVSWVLNLVDGESLDVRNNVVVLGRECGPEACCLSAYDLPSGLVCDNNCYLIESLGNFVDTDSGWLTFPEWQAWGYDQHGMVADPLFVDSTNLHLREGSPCIGAGTPIPGIAVDFDGDPRDPVHPDIGADEFVPGGAAEEQRSSQLRPAGLATVSRGVLFLPQSLDPSIVHFLLDAGGRKVMTLRPDANDVRQLAPGVYFVRRASGEGQAAIARVVIAQ